MATTFSAVDIKQLWYAETTAVTADLTGAILATILKTAKEVKNVHQDTWSIEEAEPSVTSYKNQITGSNYRQTKEMGDLVMSFTIGQYDYTTKKDLMGGTLINTDKGWKRERGVVDIYKCMIALTEDNQYVVFPKATSITREANTDGAIGLAVSATALEPDNSDVSSEYWFDSSVVVEASSLSNLSSK